VVLAGVEVDVVGDLERQVQRHRVERVQVGFDRVAVGVVGEDHGQPLAGRRPGLRAAAEEPVEARAGPCLTGLHAGLFRRDGGVEDEAADPHPDPRRRPVRGREGPVGERLETERVGRVEVEPARHVR
jgi:hypothetical protein